MTTKLSSSDEEDKKSFSLRSHPRIWIPLITLLWICLLCSLSLYLLGVFPRYITFHFPPPKDRAGENEWMNISYSIFSDFPGRTFLWRQETFISNERDGNQSWDEVVSYFDTQLSQYGWVRSEIDSPCYGYLPEASFLDNGEINYVLHYFRKGYEDQVTFGSEYIGDTICLAVWPSGSNDVGAPEFINVVMLTIKRSFLTNFVEGLFGMD